MTNMEDDFQSFLSALQSVSPAREWQDAKRILVLLRCAFHWGGLASLRLSAEQPAADLQAASTDTLFRLAARLAADAEAGDGE